MPREYRLQAPGEEVELTGMRRHDALRLDQTERPSLASVDWGELGFGVEVEAYIGGWRDWGELG